MGKEGINGIENVTKISGFKKRKMAKELHPSSGQILIPDVDGELPIPLTRADFLNEINERRLRIAQQSKETNAEVLPFTRKPETQ